MNKINKFSCAPIIISNHVACFDIVYNAIKYAPGYISKIEMKTFPFIGNKYIIYINYAIILV